MNKTIRPLGAIMIVLVIAVLVGTYVCYKGQEISSSIEIASVPTKNAVITKTDQTAEKGKSQSVSNGQKLKEAVYNAVEEKTKGKWDKKIDITAYDGTQKAAKGKWWARDAWDWIAWLQDNEEWKVLVSQDGFNCVELNSVPGEYNGFFHDVVYMFDKKNCN